MPANPDNDTGFRQLPMPISDVCCKTWPTLAPPWHRPLWHACEAGLRHWRCCAHDLSMRKFWRRCNRTQLSSISSWPGCYEVSCLCQVLTCTHINSQTCPQSRYQGVGRVFRVVAALWRLMKTLNVWLDGQSAKASFSLHIPSEDTCATGEERDNMDCGAKRGSVWFSCPGIWNTASLNAWHLEQIFSPSSATECSFERHADMRMYFHGWVPHRWLWPFTRTVSKLHGFLSLFVGLGNDMKWSQVGLAKKSYNIIIIYLSISRVETTSWTSNERYVESVVANEITLERASDMKILKKMSLNTHKIYQQVFSLPRTITSTTIPTTWN